MTDRGWRIEPFDIDTPRGARIAHADGTVCPCDLVRDPEPASEGHAVWAAVPPDGCLPGPGDSLELDYLPARTSVGVAVSARGNGRHGHP